jgi:PST family polysaccharide transporter
LNSQRFSDLRLSSSKVAHAAIWATVDGVSQTAIQLFSVLVIARLIGVEHFGVAGLALSIIYMTTLFSELFFQDVIVQKPMLEEASCDSALWSAVALGTFSALSCVLLAEPIASIMDQPAVAPLLMVLAVSLIIGGATGTLAAEMRRAMMFKQLALRTLAGRLAGAAVGISLAFYGFGAWSLVLQHLVNSLTAMIVVWLCLPRRVRLRLDLRRVQELLSFASATLVASGVWQLNVRLFSFLLGYLQGPAALGYFMIAFRVVDAAQSLINTTLHYVTLPVFSRLQDAADSLKQHYITALRISSLVGLLCFGTLLLSAESTVRLVLGVEWLPSVPVFQIMALGAVFLVSTSPTLTILSAIEMPWAKANVVLCAFVVTYLTFFAIGTGNLVFATFSLITRSIVVTALGAWLIAKHLRIGLVAQIKPSLPALAAAFVGAVVVGSLMSMLSLSPIGILTLTLAGFPSTCLAVVMLLSYPTFKSLIRFFRMSGTSTTA